MASVKYHNGSGWVTITDGQQKIKYHDGSNWVVPQRVKYYSGGWQTAWVNDISGPTGGGVYVAAWSDSIPGFTVYYNAAADPSGIATFKMQYSTNGTSWSDIGGSFNSLSTAGGNINYAPSTTNRANNYYSWFRTVIIDTLGNPTTTTAYAAVNKPYGTGFYGDPSSTSLNVGWGTYATGFNTPWRTGISDVYSGWVGSSSSYQYGYVFYGSNTFKNQCRGYAPDSATVSVSKSNASSGCGLALSFATHNYASRPTNPAGYDPTNMPNSFTSGNITYGATADVALSSGARSAMATDSGFGLVLFPGSTTQSTSCSGGSTYRVTAPPGDTTFDTDPWRITFNFTT